MRSTSVHFTYLLYLLDWRNAMGQILLTNLVITLVTFDLERPYLAI